MACVYGLDLCFYRGDSPFPPGPAQWSAAAASGTALRGGFAPARAYIADGLPYAAWKSGLSAAPSAVGGALVASAGSRQALRRGSELVTVGLATFLVGMAGVCARRAPPGFACATPFRSTGPAAAERLGTLGSPNPYATGGVS